MMSPDQSTPPVQTEPAVIQKLHDAALTGNIEAVKALIDIQRQIRYDQLVSNMDDDEFTPQTFPA